MVDFIITDAYNSLTQARICPGETNYLTLGDLEMADASKIDIQDTKAATTCDICGRESNTGWVFGFKNSASGPDAGIIIKCLKCAAFHTPMLRRSLIVAIVVGSILTLLNQGDLLIAGTWTDSFYWKIPLTYCVPFIVATYGALSNGRR